MDRQTGCNYGIYKALPTVRPMVHYKVRQWRSQLRKSGRQNRLTDGQAIASAPPYMLSRAKNSRHHDFVT